METTQIVLIIGGIAILMILFKLLFRSPNKPPKPIPSSIAAPIVEAGKRMGSVAKQAQLFTEASTLLVNRTILKKDVPRIGAALFIAGAIDYLAQKSQLNDIEYLSVTSAMLETAGLMTEGEAETFADDLPQLSSTAFGKAAMVKGGQTIQAWLSGNDDAAPARLSQYVEEWSEVPIGSI
jgi:hypothetical protein